MSKVAFSSSKNTSVLFYLSYRISVWKCIWAGCFLIPSPNILQNVYGIFWKTANIGTMYHQQSYIYASPNVYFSSWKSATYSKYFSKGAYVMILQIHAFCFVYYTEKNKAHSLWSSSSQLPPPSEAIKEIPCVKCLLWLQIPLPPLFLHRLNSKEYFETTAEWNCSLPTRMTI